MRLGLAIHGHERGVVLLVEGEVDAASVPRLAVCLDHVMADSFGTVVVDLGAVTFIDSSGLSVLAGAYRRLTEASRSLYLRNPSARVRRVLAISGMDAFLIDSASA